ncbi:hypothetical protein N2152v2_007726 [Parachlorella kessleri]
MKQQQQQSGTSAEAGSQPAARATPREAAVLVVGAGGRMGRVLTASLLKEGRTVVAAARDAERTRKAFEKLGISEGVQSSGSGILFIDSGVDITQPETLTAGLFKGVTQVVSTVGAVFGRTADGQMGYLDDMTPERVDAQGVSNLVTAAQRFMPKPQRSVEEVLSMRSAEDLARWQRLDDVIMGGQSASGLEQAADGSGAVWNGDLIVEGGGFCGARTEPVSLDLSAYDGISLRVKSDGQTFKLNIKTDGQLEVPEDVYQATFDTLPGEWTTVYIPWHEFVPVKRAKSLPNGEPLNPAKIRQFGLVLSRFSFNGFPNPRYHPGKFTLELQGGISAYKDPRPQVVLISSAGVERNAKIGLDEEARKKDIPIVQLNPGGVLNHKYTGENAVRSSGLAYCIIRPTGLTNETEGAPFLLEAHQGDRISGKIGRDEVASLVLAATRLPSAANKTLEVRRSEALDGKGQAMGAGDVLRLFLGAAEDRLRARVGIEPFPAPAPPPPAPSQERKKEILSDARVVASQLGGRGGRVREEAETAKAKTLTVTYDGREKAVASKEALEAAERAEQAQQAAGASPVAAAAGNGVAEGQHADAAQGEGAVPENVREAREWIRMWRARSLESQLPEDSRV